MNVLAPAPQTHPLTAPDAVEDPLDRMGVGACSISGCPCPAYQETYGSDLCSNCGHKYTDHW